MRGSALGKIVDAERAAGGGRRQPEYWTGYESIVMSRLDSVDTLAGRLGMFFHYNGRRVLAEAFAASAVAVVVSIVWRTLDFGNSIRTFFFLMRGTM